MVKHEITFFLAGSYFARNMQKPLTRRLVRVGSVYAFADRGDSPREWVSRIAEEIYNNKKSLTEAEWLVIEIRGMLEFLCDANHSSRYSANLFDPLVDVINRCFGKKKTIILRSPHSDNFIDVDGTVRKLPADFPVKAKHEKLTRNYEDRIRKKTDGVIIELSEAYSYIKHRGYKLSGRNYERNCYRDTARAVLEYLLKAHEMENETPVIIVNKIKPLKQEKSAKAGIVNAWRRSHAEKELLHHLKTSEEGQISEPSFGRNRYIDNQIPQQVQEYYEEEVKETIASVCGMLEEPAVVFICVTDIHYDSRNLMSSFPSEITFERMITNMSAVIKAIPCSFILNLGDDTDGNYPNVRELFRIEKYLNDKLLDLGKPYYRVIGNHDTNGYGGIMLTGEEMSRIYCSHISSYQNVVYNPSSLNTEYYIDYEEHGIRLVVLNTMFNGIFCYSESTGEWLEKEALKTSNLVLLCEHLAPIHTMNMNAEPLRNREPVIKALKGFDGHIVQICGHSHCDYSFTDGDETYSPWLTVFSNLQRCSRRRQSDLGDITVGNTNGEFLCPRRKGWTFTEDCWDVVVIRPESGKINFVRFGAGEDREFTIDGFR